MAKTVGVVMTDRIVAGLIDDHRIVGALQNFPEKVEGEPEQDDALVEMPADSLWEMICDHVVSLAPKGSGVKAVGIAMPGMIRGGAVEDSPNLPQLKGARVEDAVRAGLAARNLDYSVCAINDA